MNFVFNHTSATQRIVADAGKAALALGHALQVLGPNYGPSTPTETLARIDGLANDLLAQLATLGGGPSHLSHVDHTATQSAMDYMHGKGEMPTRSGAVHLSAIAATRATNPAIDSTATIAVMKSMQAGPADATNDLTKQILAEMQA